jgi:hypothetical protein
MEERAVQGSAHLDVSAGRQIEGEAEGVAARAQGGALQIGRGTG